VRTQSHTRTVDFSNAVAGQFPHGMCDVARQAPLLWVLRDRHYQGVRSHVNTMAAAAGPITRLTLALLQTGPHLQAQLQGSNLKNQMMLSARLAAYRVRQKFFTEPFIALLRYGQWPLQTSKPGARARQIYSARAAPDQCERHVVSAISSPSACYV